MKVGVEIRQPCVFLCEALGACLSCISGMKGALLLLVLLKRVWNKPTERNSNRKSEYKVKKCANGDREREKKKENAEGEKKKSNLDWAPLFLPLCSLPPLTPTSEVGGPPRDLPHSPRRREEGGVTSVTAGSGRKYLGRAENPQQLARLSLLRTRSCI